MARLQQHHIRYDPEWKVEVSRQMHTCVGTSQITKATVEQYARLTNFIHALTEEWNRMRMELDIGGDMRIIKPGKRPLVRTRWPRHYWTIVTEVQKPGGTIYKLLQCERCRIYARWFGLSEKIDPNKGNHFIVPTLKNANKFQVECRKQI